MKDYDFPRPPYKDLRILEAWQVNPELLTDPQTYSQKMRHFMNGLGLNVVLGPFTHPFQNPPGVSVVAAIAESHVGSHTYVEYGGHMEIQLSTCVQVSNIDLGPKLLFDIFDQPEWIAETQLIYPDIGSIFRNLSSAFPLSLAITGPRDPRFRVFHQGEVVKDLEFYWR